MIRLRIAAARQVVESKTKLPLVYPPREAALAEIPSR
jgi:hypothetical protein